MYIVKGFDIYIYIYIYLIGKGFDNWLVINDVRDTTDLLHNIYKLMGYN